MDNVKLAELVRNKESEIVRLSNLLKSKENDNSMEMKPTFHVGRGSRRAPDEVKSFYENELKALHQQVTHLQRILAMNLTVEDKTRILHSELNAVKENSIKKIQLIESKLKIANNDNSSQEHSSTNKDRGFSDWQNEINESRYQHQVVRNASDVNIRPPSSQSRKQQEQTSLKYYDQFSMTNY